MLAAGTSSQVIINSGIKYGNVPRVIHLSSGAVYERQDDLSLGLLEVQVPYDDSLPPSYRNAKLLIENMISNAHQLGVIQAANPRLFAFSGPGLPIDAHFAVGNFMRDALLKESITIKGSPQTRRSYMYPTDLVTWLLTVLCSPTELPINVGNNSSVSLEELASVISRLSNGSGIISNNLKSSPDSYFPSTLNTEKIYGVQIKVDLEAGLRKWFKYLVSHY
jgi:dTDP-glucose 4,6-dehydratase